MRSIEDIKRDKIEACKRFDFDAACKYRDEEKEYNKSNGITEEEPELKISYLPNGGVVVNRYFDFMGMLVWIMKHNK